MIFLLYYGFSNLINVSPKENYSLGEFETEQQQESNIFSFEACKNNNGVVSKNSISDINICRLNSRIFVEGIPDFISNAEYFSPLEKKCKGNICCLNSISEMSEGAYMEAYLNKNNDLICPSSFNLTQLKCNASLFWCEPIETFKKLSFKQWHKVYLYTLKKSKLTKTFPIAYIYTPWKKVLKIKRGMSKKELISIVGQFNINSNFNNIVLYYSHSSVGLNYEIAVKLSKELLVEDLSYLKNPRNYVKNISVVGY